VDGRQDLGRSLFARQQDPGESNFPRMAHFTARRAIRFDSSESQSGPEEVTQQVRRMEGVTRQVQRVTPQVRLPLRDVCADSRDALRAGLAGLLLNHTGRATDRMGYKCDIKQLDLLEGGQMMLIHMDGHGGPAPLDGPGACSWSEPTAACPGTGLGSLKSIHRWIEQHGMCHCTEWADPDWKQVAVRLVQSSGL
jgi:hypothetical protein